MNAGNSRPVLTKSQSELIAYLFDARATAASDTLAAWIAASPRYAAFAEKYKDKIRKKLRVTRDPSAAVDLLYELQIGYWLLQEKRFEVTYEPYAAGKTRGPDYAVAFRANFLFHIEVTHMRGSHPAPDSTTPDGNSINQRLIDVVCAKLGQMRPNQANLLCIVSTPAVLGALHLPAHIAWIKDKAEHGDPAFYARHRFLNAADFFKYFERLSGMILDDPTGEHASIFWQNPQARVKLLEPVRNILQRGFSLAQE